MNITIISVGKIKEKYFVSAIDEYRKRLSKYCRLNLIEVPDEKAPENLSENEKIAITVREGRKIIEKIPKNSTVITLEIEGKEFTSEELAKKIEDFALNGKSHLSFIIGGSLGLSPEVKKLSTLKISFSKMTFPHQLFKVMLLEQLYRAYRILKNEPYHK